MTYYLIYADSPLSMRVGGAIRGPVFFASEVEALNYALEYATQQIFDSVLDLFLSDFEDVITDLPQAFGTVEEFKSYILGLPNDEEDKREILDWYFGQANDEFNQAFYEIMEVSRVK